MHMSKKWQRGIGVFIVRLLQITILTGMLFYVRRIVLGFSPAPDLVDILTFLVLVLLGILILALNWLIFEANKIEQKKGSK